jgi:hypothetical protein
MFSRRAVFTLFSALASAIVPAVAGSSSLSKKERWLVVAHTPDVDAAIGIAGLYAEQSARVVASEDGKFSVVMGPYKARSVRDLNDEIGQLPGDATLLREGTTGSIVWQSNSNKPWNPVAIENGKNARLSLGKFEFSLTQSVTTDELAGILTITGGESGGSRFQFLIGEAGDAVGPSYVGLAKLDPLTEVPQLVVSRYTGGAHCCMQTYILTKPAAKSDWVVLDLGESDGDGYALVDLDNDGVLELAQVDNEFHYTFDTYSNSFAPVVYRQLRGTDIEDVSMKGLSQHALKQDLAALEFAAKIDRRMWKTNGFLAAWVASKVRLGQGEEAWRTMLENFDRKPGVALQHCAIEKTIEECPMGMLSEVPFPVALARFLEGTGYGALPDAALLTVE